MALQYDVCLVTGFFFTNSTVFRRICKQLREATVGFIMPVVIPTKIARIIMKFCVGDLYYLYCSDFG